MTCDDARLHLADLDAGGGAPGEAPGLREHLAGCAACAALEREERALSDLLQARLPGPAAPDRLRRALEDQVARLEARSAPLRRGAPSGRWAWPLLAAAASAAALGLWLVPRGPPGPVPPALAEEAVNDHLRALVAPRPDVESGGVHQVRPWFEGRLDFAPPVPDLEAAGLRLRGGSVGYFRDRRAAVVHYQLRLHQVTLLAFPAEGLALPERPGAPETLRGFHALLWRQGALGLALVSDADPRELEGAAALIRP
ncbi:MAG TPA: hypothetical protein VEP68_08605 [Anaeromyxobacteraceae bacterium]|nr:hypothetical protein [Anaeromyxobacteraceae bacterium]